MDRYVLAQQIRRNLLSPRMAVILLASLLLVGVQYWTTNHASYVILDSAPNFLRDVMLFSQYGTGSGLMPFFAALAGSGVVSTERHYSRLGEVVVRDGRARYNEPILRIQPMDRSARTVPPLQIISYSYPDYVISFVKKRYEQGIVNKK